MTTFINANEIKAATRNAIAKRFNVKTDWAKPFGKRINYIVVPAAMATTEFVSAIEAAVAAAR